MPPAEKIANFQAALLELLAQDLPPDAIHARLRDDPAFADFRAYVSSFEPRMLAVAVELVQKWGKRAPVRVSDAAG